MQGEGGSTSVRWVSSLLIMQSVMKGHKEAQIRGKKSTFMPLVFFFFFLFKTFQHLSNLTCIVRAFLQKLQK